MNMSALGWAAVSLIVFLAAGYVEETSAYVVGSGLNVRFAQLLPSDAKYQHLRQILIKTNTNALVRRCRLVSAECSAALARTRFKPSKQFYALAKAVVTYIKSESSAKPAGYVGTAMFCHEDTCIPDMDPPVVSGGCSELIACGGHRNWALAHPNQLS